MLLTFLNFSTGALQFKCCQISLLSCFFSLSHGPFLFSLILYSPSPSFTLSLLFWRLDGKRLLISMWCLCEHNPSVLKQGDLASGFPFCISPRPWKFCVSGTTPYWVPKFKNLHKAQEWSVHSCQLYTHVVLLDEKKTLLGNHYCLGEVIYAVLITVWLSLDETVDVSEMCTPDCPTCWIRKNINAVCLVSFHWACQMKTDNMPWLYLFWTITWNKSWILSSLLPVLFLWTDKWITFDTHLAAALWEVFINCEPFIY